MNRPSLDSLFLARFKVSPLETVRILDIGMRPKNLAKEAEYWRSQGNSIGTLNIDKRHFAYAVCWPLIAASSVQSKHRGGSFIAEYIVPQLLLQWVSENKDVDGIAYFSVKADSLFDPPHGAANFGFPTRSDAATGYCSELMRKFEMTEAVSWQILTDYKSLCPLEPVNARMDVELIPNKKDFYRYSKFFEIEKILLVEESSTFTPKASEGAN